MTHWKHPHKNDGKYCTRSNVRGRHQKKLRARKAKLKAQAEKNGATNLAAAHAKNKQNMKSTMKTKKRTFSRNPRWFFGYCKPKNALPAPPWAWGLFYDSSDDSSEDETSCVSNLTDDDSLYRDLNKVVTKKQPAQPSLFSQWYSAQCGPNYIDVWIYYYHYISIKISH